LTRSSISQALNVALEQRIIDGSFPVAVLGTGLAALFHSADPRSSARFYASSRTRVTADRRFENSADSRKNSIILSSRFTLTPRANGFLVNALTKNNRAFRRHGNTLKAI